ncbi:hypothetical protein [Burkholderia glumae]|uniref:hypothetical protein n=1 Tax=Burkholderia glumae TaxID=337 RepID=UPI00214F9B8A|nr:hypothetical protein [Burkholderia glumae]
MDVDRLAGGQRLNEFIWRGQSKRCPGACGDRRLSSLSPLRLGTLRVHLGLHLSECVFQFCLLGGLLALSSVDRAFE